jgi:phage terminase small subunit
MKKPKAEPAAPPPYPEAPPHLTERSKALWRRLGPDHAKSVARRALFQAALEALDRGDKAREVVAQEGMTSRTEGTGAVHVHPLVKVELESRRQFSRLWEQLSLVYQNQDEPDRGPLAALLRDLPSE